MIGFASYGDHWRNLRRLTILELFSSNRLAITRIREEEVQLLGKQLFEECIGQKSKVDLRPRFVEISFNIMPRMIYGKWYYGKDEVTQEGKEFQILMKEFAELQGNGNLNDFSPILQWVDFQGVEKKMLKLMNQMDSFLQKLLDENQKNRHMSAGKDQSNMTLIDVMLDLQQRQPEFYTHETLKGVIESIMRLPSLQNFYYTQLFAFALTKLPTYEDTIAKRIFNSIYLHSSGICCVRKHHMLQLLVNYIGFFDIHFLLAFAFNNC